MKIRIEMSDGTVGMWSLDFKSLDTDLSVNQLEDETLETICGIIGDPDTVRA